MERSRLSSLFPAFLGPSVPRRREENWRAKVCRQSVGRSVVSRVRICNWGWRLFPSFKSCVRHTFSQLSVDSADVRNLVHFGLKRRPKAHQNFCQICSQTAEIGVAQRNFWWKKCLPKFEIRTLVVRPWSLRPTLHRARLIPVNALHSGRTPFSEFDGIVLHKKGAARLWSQGHFRQERHPLIMHLINLTRSPVTTRPFTEEDQYLWTKMLCKG